MATDFILENESARVVDGDLNVDNNLRVQGMLEVEDHRGRVSRLHPNRLELVPRSDDDHRVTLSSFQLSGVYVVVSDLVNCKTVNALNGDLTRLSLGNASEIDGHIPTPGEMTLKDRDGNPTLTMTGEDGAIHFRRSAVSSGGTSMLYIYQDQPAEDDDQGGGARPIDVDVGLPEPRVAEPLHDVVINDEMRRRPKFPGRPGGVRPDPRPLQVLKATIEAEAEAGSPVLRDPGRAVKSPAFNRASFARDGHKARLDQSVVDAVVNADTLEAIPEAMFDLFTRTSIVSHSQELHDWGLAYHPAHRMIFQGDGRAAMTIDLHGKVGVGMDDPNYPLHVNGAVAATEPLQALSDDRCMKSSAPIDGALEKIMSLAGVAYEWDAEELPDMELPEGRRYGFVAQQVEAVIPEAVSLSDGEAYSVAAGSIVPVLVEAMKQQQAVIDELQQRVRALEVEHDAAVVES